ncbi:hypothetical protein QYF61_019769 [Mycteria americana]|uniref:Uncharacterized protein n=1 Tax=Mycteria americana TaxID=33587 RepID=A0AAN7MK57_MYCAM|nr:hypothetical protein QYF61_019769 [Mycteria americana]
MDPRDRRASSRHRGILGKNLRSPDRRILSKIPGTRAEGKLAVFTTFEIQIGKAMGNSSIFVYARMSIIFVRKRYIE